MAEEGRGGNRWRDGRRLYKLVLTLLLRFEFKTKIKTSFSIIKDFTNTFFSNFLKIKLY